MLSMLSTLGPLAPLACKALGTDDTAGQHMKGPEMVVGSLVTELQPTVVAQPGQGPLDHVTGLAKTAAMRTAPWGQQARDHQTHEQADNVLKAVSSIPLQRFGLLFPLACRVRQHRQLLEHRLDQLFIPLVGRARKHQQRDAVALTNYVPFTAWFAAIGRIRAGVRPPDTAPTEALSMIDRS